MRQTTVQADARRQRQHQPLGDVRQEKDRGLALRLMIADGGPIFREGLRRLLEAEPGFQVVGQASDAAEAIRLARELTPDVVLFVVALHDPHGLDAVRELATSPTPCRIILMTAAIERAQIVEALRLGVRGVLTKESTTELLLKSIRCVMADQYWVGRESVSDLVHYVRQHTRDADAERPRKNFGLTPREMQIVSMVVAGYPNKDIAQRFSLSQDTVKHHLSNVFDKLGVSNRLELALFAIHHQLGTDA